MRSRVAIFDLDGTLLDTLRGIAASFNAGLSELGLPVHPTEDYRAFIGFGPYHLARCALPAGADESLVRDAVGWYQAHYPRLSTALTEPFPGIPEALARLRAHGVLLAVLSNKPHTLVSPQIEAYFPGLFCACRGQRDGAPVKPDPAAYHALLRDMALTEAHCVYVGDMAVDMEFAARAGIHGIFVPWGFGRAAAPGDDTADTAEALADKILSLLG